MPDPASTPVVDPLSTPSPSLSAMSRFLRIVVVLVRETGWVLKELGLGAGRCAVALWSLARQRRLEDKRRRAFQSLGEDLRQGTVAASMHELVAECERCDGEIREHRDALTSKTPPLSLFARGAHRVRLSEARAARRAALRKLGEGGVSLASPAQRETLLALDAAMSKERARRAGLAQPWRALSLPRRMAISAVVVLLAGAGIVLGTRAWKASAEGGTADTVAASEASPRPRSAGARTRPEKGRGTAVENPQERKPDPVRSALDFAQQRKAALPGQWVVYGANPVLARGDLDQWDDLKVGSPVVLKDGNQYRMWYRGCHLRLLEYTCGVGHAVSTDGISWTKTPGPVLVPSDPHEMKLLHGLTVIKAKDRYWMWYSVRSELLSDRPYATINLATSKDGLAWQPGGPVLRAVTEQMAALDASAFFDGTMFHLWYRDYPSEGVEAVMHVTSADGAQWQSAGYTFLDNIKIKPIAFSVLPDGRGGYRALYVPASRDDQTKGGVGALDGLLSTDGNEWRPSETLAKLPVEAVLRSKEHASGVSAVENAEGLWAWVAALPKNGAEDVRLVFLREGGR